MIYCSVDVGNYDSVEDVYSIEGWGFLDNLQQVDVHVSTLDGKPVTCNVVRKKDRMWYRYMLIDQSWKNAVFE